MNEREPDAQPHESSGDAAAYVLGALEEREANDFRAHLETCGSCREQVAELQLAGDALAVAVPSVRTPEPLQKRIMSVVRSEAELLNAAGHDADRVRPARRRRGIWRPAYGLAAASLVAVGVGVGALTLPGDGGPRTRLAIAAVNSAPGARAVLRETGGRAELDVSGMAQPPRGRVYQVWLKRPSSAAPEPTNALFSVTSAGTGSVAVPGSIRGVSQVMVTDEPLGGSRIPTRAPVISVVPPA